MVEHKEDKHVVQNGKLEKLRPNLTKCAKGDLAHLNLCHRHYRKHNIASM